MARVVSALKILIVQSMYIAEYTLDFDIRLVVYLFSRINKKKKKKEKEVKKSKETYVCSC